MNQQKQWLGTVESCNLCKRDFQSKAGKILVDMSVRAFRGTWRVLCKDCALGDGGTPGQVYAFGKQEKWTGTYSWWKIAEVDEWREGESK